jgi:hypothetical protein
MIPRRHKKRMKQMKQQQQQDTETDPAPTVPANKDPPKADQGCDRCKERRSKGRRAQRFVPPAGLPLW